MDRSHELTEEELAAHVRGDSAPEQAARIEAAAEADPNLRAELAVMGGLKEALKASTDAPDTRAFGWKRLETEIAQTKAATPVPRVQSWRLAAAGLGVVALLQGTYIALAPAGGDTPLYRTVSEETSGFNIAIAFVPDATVAEIEALLRQNGARITDGPSAIGLYRVSFETEDARASALATFGTAPLIDLVAEN